MAATPKVKDLLYEIGRLKKENAELKISKPYGLVWEDKPEQFDKDTENTYPVLRTKGGKFKDVELDASTDHNVLIEGDNYHALSVLSYTHKGKVDVIYIDPPYNTGNASWKYNNKIIDAEDAFRHSKFISFLEKRLVLSRSLMSDKGVIVVTIDDYEIHNVRLLMDQIFGEQNRLGTVVIVHNPRGRNDDKYFATMHEYALFYSKGPEAVIKKFEHTEENLAKEFPFEDETSNYGLVSFMRTGNNSDRHTRPNLFYPVYVNRDNKLSLVKGSGYTEVLPINEKGEEKTWRWSKETLAEDLDDILIKRTGKGIRLFKKRRPENVGGKKPKTIWYEPKYDASSHGISLLEKIFSVKDKFPYPKSLYALIDTLRITTSKDSTVLDFFSGSGTTGHAVLTLNKEDGGNRRFILCTNNENNICEEVTYERLNRVMKGYTTSSGSKVDGLGGNLKYLKTDFVPKHIEYGLTDEARLDLTRRANLLLALKENTFTTVETADQYEIFSSPTRMMGVYFTEDKDELDTMLQALKKHAKDRVVSVYIFSWKKGAYKSGFEDYPGFHFEDIPEPILDVYRSIGY